MFLVWVVCASSFSWALVDVCTSVVGIDPDWLWGLWCLLSLLLSLLFSDEAPGGTPSQSEAGQQASVPRASLEGLGHRPKFSCSLCPIWGHLARVHRWLPPMMGLEVPQEAKPGTEAGCHQCWAWGCSAKETEHAKARWCLFGVSEPLRDFRNVCNASVWERNFLKNPFSYNGKIFLVCPFTETYLVRLSTIGRLLILYPLSYMCGCFGS